MTENPSEAKQVLLVDTNRAAYPIYRALHELGHHVWVVGGNPGDVLAKISPNYIQLDYSKSDQLAALLESHRFDYIVPGCTDVSYQVCSEIGQDRFPGIDRPDATFTLNNKEAFRRIAGELTLPVPEVVPLEMASSRKAVIVKPVDSFSGRGMTVLRDPTPPKLDAAVALAAKASRSGQTIVEEFVPGQLFSHSAFVRGGKVVTDFIVQEDCTVNPFAVDTSRILHEFPAGMLESLRSNVESLAAALRLVDGLMHTQFIACGDRYWIIEVTRRCPGDLYSLLIEYSTGYPYAAGYAGPFVGQNRLPDGPTGARDLVIRHTVTSRQGEGLWGYRFSRPVSVRLFVPLATAGDFIKASPDGRAAIFFLSCASRNEQDALYASLLSGALYTIN